MTERVYCNPQALVGRTITEVRRGQPGICDIELRFSDRSAARLHLPQRCTRSFPVRAGKLEGQTIADLKLVSGAQRQIRDRRWHIGYAAIRTKEVSWSAHYEADVRPDSPLEVEIIPATNGAAA